MSIVLKDWMPGGEVACLSCDEKDFCVAAWIAGVDFTPECQDLKPTDYALVSASAGTYNYET